MAQILVVSDVEEVREQIASVLDSDENHIVSVSSARAVLPILMEESFDLVIADSQIGSFGGFGLCYEIKLQGQSNVVDETKVLILLDREADTWLARKSGCDGYLIKPLVPLRLKKAVNEIIASGSYFDELRTPKTIRP